MSCRCDVVIGVRLLAAFSCAVASLEEEGLHNHPLHILSVDALLKNWHSSLPPHIVEEFFPWRGGTGHLIYNNTASFPHNGGKFLRSAVLAQMGRPGDTMICEMATLHTGAGRNRSGNSAIPCGGCVEQSCHGRLGCHCWDASVMPPMGRNREAAQMGRSGDEEIHFHPNSSKNTFIQKHFHPQKQFSFKRERQSHPTLSSKRVSSNDTFIL